MIVLLLLPSASLATIVEAEEASTKIYVRIVGTDTGVSSQLQRRREDDADFRPIDDRIDGNFTLPRCAYGTYFRVEPKHSEYLIPSAEPCREEIRFDVHKKLYASLLAKALDISGLKDVSATADLGVLPANLEIAYAQGDTALVAQISTEIYARLAKSTLSIDSEPYRVLALDAGKQAVRHAGIAAETELEMTHSKKGYVLSSESVGEIRLFQEQAGIPVSGKLDTPTLRELTGKTVGTILSERIDF